MEQTIESVAEKLADAAIESSDEDESAVLDASSASAATGAATAAAKKKKKRRNKKKATAASGDAAAAEGDGTSAPAAKPSAASKPPTAVPSQLPFARGVSGFTDSYVTTGQTCPPSIPVAALFPSGQFPEGEIHAHPGDFNAYRVTDEEKRNLDRMNSSLYQELREAAEVHRHVRKHAQSIIKPGIKLVDMCEQIENLNRKLVGVRWPCSL